MPARSLFAAALLTLAAAAGAPRPAAAGPPCLDDLCGRDPHRAAACPPRYRHPALYRCDVEVGTEPVERPCFVVEEDVICVPPITSSPLDGLRDLLSGKRRRGAGGAGCGAAGCDGAGACGACGACRARARRAGWLSRLTRGGCSGIRCVESLTTEDREDGVRCTYEWTAVRVDACGRPVRDPADEPEAAEPDSGPGEVPPPAPAPDYGDGGDPAGDEPAERVPGADDDDAGVSPVPPKTGVAGQAVGG